LRARKKLEKDRKQAAHNPPAKDHSSGPAATHSPGL